MQRRHLKLTDFAQSAGEESKAETHLLRLSRDPGNKLDPAGHPSESRCRV
jgi:hypothetical protein